MVRQNSYCEELSHVGLIEKNVCMCQWGKCQNKKTKLNLTLEVGLAAHFGCCLVVAGGGVSKSPLWAEISQVGLGSM